MIAQNKFDTILANFNEKRSFSTDIPESADIFISTLGFEEDRSAVLFRSMAENNRLKDSTCIILEYPTNKEDNEKTRPLFEKYRDRVHVLKYLQYKRETICENISSAIPTNAKHIIIDISTMSSFVFYPLFYELFNSFGTASLSVVYAEAKTYQPKFEEWKEFIKNIRDKKANMTDLLENEEENNFQTKEIDNIYSSDLLSGTNPDPLPERLIAIPNFATIRMRTFCNYLRDNPISEKNHIWVFGRPPGEDNKWRLGAVMELYKEFYKLYEYYEACTLDYKDIWMRLEKVWQKEHLDYHLNIATLGSKMQHLGTFFFLLLHKEVTLLLSEPKEYVAKSYSEGFGNSWVISFGNIDKLKDDIKSFNVISCNWENNQ